jgi:hypothetical protein
MNRMHVPPEPPPSHVDRRAQPHNLEAGRSYLAVARLVFPGAGPGRPGQPRFLSLSAGCADRQSQKWIEPMGGSIGPDRPARSPQPAAATQSEEGT